jgi:Permeases of the drug/metabolite transporter (DMT) superfamily
LLNNIINWVNKKGHVQGIFWTISSCFFSNVCDVLVRCLGVSLPAMEITFFRLFFGALLLLPIVLKQGKTAFRINNKRWHLVRVIVGFGAMACWVYGASITSLPSITTISFACPLFVLPLAYLFLGEKSDWRRVLSVVFGFLGVIIIAIFEGNEATAFNYFSIHLGVSYLLVAAILFAFSDVLNKKMIATESLVSLLFYFYFGTTLLAIVPALVVWQGVALKDLFGLLLLGASGILVLYCILRAVESTEIASVAPYKYIELIFSIVIGYFLFNELIKLPTLIGAALIIPSSFLIAYHEVYRKRG